MPIHNSDITDNFNKVADLLEIKGSNPFRVRAYRNAARTIGGLSKNVSDLIAEDRPLTDLAGIGKDLAHKIREIVDTGRLINEREPYEVDMQQLMEGAKERGCCMELNAHPDRLDLNDIFCKMAKDMRLKIAISTDAHTTDGLDDMRIGIGQARRGWLEAKDVLNTRSWKELKKLLKRD